MENKIPKIVFIVPYRDREFHRNVFYSWTKELVEKNNYLVIFSHQNDKRLFNRGGVKNLGFIYIKEKYPEHYKDIVLVFHDVDLLIGDLSIDFSTKKGIVKHFFGFKKTLGGAFSIKGEDFENINGFPCYWTWGYEDNAIYQRWCLYKNNKEIIDYSHFCDLKSPYWFKKSGIIWHGDYRIVNKEESWEKFKKWDDFSDGLSTTKLLKYSVNNFKSENFVMLNIHQFHVFNKETKKAFNEKLNGKTKNFGTLIKKENIKSNKEKPKKIFGNLIGKH